MDDDGMSEGPGESPDPFSFCFTLGANCVIFTLVRKHLSRQMAKNAVRPLPSVDLLRALYRYDPDTGELWRLVDRGRYKAGSLVKGKTHNGYQQVWADGQRWFAHRLIWKLYYGVEPGPIIDHRNGDRLDNRIANLREATVSQNTVNTQKVKGSSKYRGVVYRKPYVVTIKANGKLRRIGEYDSEIEAALAYDRAARKYHGEFAALNFPDDVLS